MPDQGSRCAARLLRLPRRTLEALTALAMVFKLIKVAQKSWRCLDGHNQLPKLITGVKFADGGRRPIRRASIQSRLIPQAVNKIRR